MKKGFTSGWSLAVALLVGLALLGFTGCGGSSGGGGSGGGAFAGNYTGTFNGSDQGTVVFTVDGNGIVAGVAHSTMEDADYVVSGDVNEAGELSAGLYGGGVYTGTYVGTIDAGGAVRGTWRSEDGSESGTFAAQKQ